MSQAFNERSAGIMRICIIGLAKSGTSALYESVKASLPPPRRILFEPKSPSEFRYVLGNGTANALTKIMFTSAAALGFDPAAFTHNICIVRDPRDVAVSSLLYRFNRIQLIKDKALTGRLIEALQRKEQEPDVMPVSTILDMLESDGARKFIASFESTLAKFQELIATHKDLFVLRFEDMIEGNLDPLSEFLSLKISPPPRLSGWTSKIGRKGESGDWRNWFCDADVNLFQPHLQTFIAAHGYDATWQQSGNKSILPEHCSGYVKTLMLSRVNDPYLRSPNNASIEALKSAAEDGKPMAMLNLARNVIATEPDAAKALLTQLVEMEHTANVLSLGDSFRKSRDLRKALFAYRIAYAANNASLARRTLAPLVRLAAGNRF